MSDLIRWDPFERGLSLRDAMSQFFDENFMWDWPFTRGGVRPLALDVRETDEALVVEGSLPGIKPEEVDVSLSGNILTIKGEHKQEKEEEKGKYHFRERRYEAYRRTITLPMDVNADAADASFEDGVLTLTLPKVEETKAKRIEVKA
jgi:HSP20 family protein